MATKTKEENRKNVSSTAKSMKNKSEEANEKKVIKTSGLTDIRSCIVLIVFRK